MPKIVANERPNDECDSSHGYSLIPELHQHASHHVVEVVAVERPSSWVVGVECDPDAAHHRERVRARVLVFLRGNREWVDGARRSPRDFILVFGCENDVSLFGKRTGAGSIEW